MITYCGSCGSMPTRSSAALITTAPSSVASYRASPPPSRPKGVRTALTITLLAIRPAYSSAHERQIGGETLREGGDEPHRRLHVLERAELVRRVHVARRHGDQAGGNAGAR